MVFHGWPKVKSFQEAIGAANKAGRAMRKALKAKRKDRGSSDVHPDEFYIAFIITFF